MWRSVGTAALAVCGALPLAPLGGAWSERLELPSGGVAYAMPPLGAREPRLVVAGVHGAGDRPDWSCGGLRLGGGAQAFFVCPQGNPYDAQRFSWPSAKLVEARVTAAVAGLEKRYGPYVRSAPRIYAGFSQGAILAEPFLLRHAAEYPVAILAEGGYDTLMKPAFARRYREQGGRRIAILCGTPGCFAHARAAKPVLESAGLEVVVGGDARAGHNLNERLQAALRQMWPNIVRELP